jgi:diadenylate cyclase
LGVASRPTPAMAEALELVVPGCPLREALERILQAKRGALIVIGDGPDVLALSSGGFLLDAQFTPQRLSELAKMDGAIIVSPDVSRIARANVHLMPDPSIPTSETGTRHRTAERVARSVDVPVVSVSAAMGIITVYRNDTKHVIQPLARLNDRVSQALQTLQRFRQRFDMAVAALSALEIEDTVALRDIMAVLQPAELVTRIAEEARYAIREMGDDGRLLRLQLEELVAGVEEVLHLVVRDYVQIAKAPPSASAPGTGTVSDNGSADARPAPDRFPGPEHLPGPEHVPGPEVERALFELARLDSDALLDARKVARALGLPGSMEDPDAVLEPRGFRMLHRLPRFPEAVIDRIVARFANLQGIMRASLNDLEQVGGVGEARAHVVKDGLSRLVEASILDRYS